MRCRLGRSVTRNGLTRLLSHSVPLKCMVQRGGGSSEGRLCPTTRCALNRSRTGRHAQYRP